MVLSVEGFGTVGALEGLLLRVEPLMNLKIGLGHKNLETDLTHELDLSP